MTYRIALFGGSLIRQDSAHTPLMTDTFLGWFDGIRLDELQPPTEIPAKAKAFLATP